MTTAAVLAFGGATTGALAQEPETPTSTSVEVTPTSESSTPPSTPDSTPPSTPETTPPASETEAPPSTSVTVPPSETVTPPVVTTTPAETSNAPAQADRAEQKAPVQVPDVKVTASTDKTQYLSHEPVKITATITNKSAFPAERVTASAFGIQVPQGGWGDFQYPGATLAPGESRTVEVAGPITHVKDGKLDLNVSAQAQAGDVSFNDNTVFLRPAVTQTFGGVNGTVYADANRNGKLEPGEPIAGGIVTLYGGSPRDSYVTTTNADGKFEFSNVPSGEYYTYYELSDGWVVHKQAGAEQFVVEPGKSASVDAPAWRPFSELLTASVSLDQTKYHYPATARMTLTLANTSQYRVDDIQAGCNRVGNSNHLGFGPEWNAVFGPGVDLAAGESKTFEINEALPEGAALAGEVWISCDFQPNAGYNTDGPTASAKASVTGGKGNLTLLLADDKNENHTRDAGEGVAGLRVGLLDADNNKIIEAVSDSEGTANFFDVPVGHYRSLLLGPWDYRYGPQDANQPVVGWGATRFLGLKPGSAPAELRSTLKLDKAQYESHESVKLSLTVQNIGGRTAERVRLNWQPFNVNVPEEQWGDFRPNGPGVLIAAGESRTFEATGTIRSFTNGQLDVWGVVDYLGMPSSLYSAKATVMQTAGDVTGVVYTDKNRNGQQDAGEAAADVVVEAYGGTPSGSHRTTTDAEGRFSFKGIPSGDYSINYTLAGGWIVHTEQGTFIRVQPNAPVALVARAERPYSESLKATLTLDKETYSIGEDAKVTITLTNTSDREISGIQAGCNRVGDDHHLGGSIVNPNPTGWGDLLPPGKGVTVGAGETKTFVAVEKVPAFARVMGKVIASCDFAPNPGYNTDGPYASDWAYVPGGFGSMKGQLFEDRNSNWTADQGETIPDTRLVLRDEERDLDVAEATSDAKGNVHFAKVPAGNYLVRVDGPWEFLQSAYVQVTADGEARTSFIVVASRTPEQGGGTTAPTTVAPAAGGGAGDALAKTGASVLGLGLLGALLVAFGFGASVIGRRKIA